MSEGRFQHLLQPIRDLSQNWNIDLAQELEEYLDELEHLNIAFDPNDEGSTAALRPRDADAAADSGSKVMNFAEAALLIQGTSVIYSRKVEYLYALVFQTLAHLSKQHEDKQNSAGDKQQGGNANANEVEGHESDADDLGGGDLLGSALRVYDELEEARETQITLRKATTNAVHDSDEYKKRHDQGLSRSKNNLQASVALMGSLVPGERDHGDAFKLMSCNLHVSGVMLLDEGSRKFLEEETDFKYVRGEKTPRRASLGRVDWDLADQGDGGNPAMTLNFDNIGDGDDDDDDGADGGYDQPDFGGYDHEEAEATNDSSGDYEPVEQAPAYNDEQPPPALDADEDSGITTRSKKRVGFTRAAAAERDPWAPLDPYDASSAMSRPFRKGRSYPRKPPYKKGKLSKRSNKDGAVGVEDDAVDGLDDPSFKDRFFSSANRSQWSSWVWAETSEKALEKTFKKKFCKAPVLVKSCDELWKLEAKWKSLVRRFEAKEEQSAQAMLLQEEAEEEEQQIHEMALNRSDAPLDLHLSAHEHDDTAEGPVDEEDDDGYDDAGGADFDWGGGDMGDEHMGDKYPDSAEASAYMSLDNGDRPLTYEEICRQHIESFMKGAEQYVRESDLTKQVNEWQTKLTPLLKEQDERPPFDIQHYGREIIGHLKHEHKTRVSMTPRQNKRQKRSESDEDEEEEVTPEAVTFDRLVGGKNHYEVCRMFLASLQLANNGNVQLVHGKTAAEQSQVPFQMQLLTTSNVYESIQTS